MSSFDEPGTPGLDFFDAPYHLTQTDKGKPGESRRRKAMDLQPALLARIARLPKQWILFVLSTGLVIQARFCLEQGSNED